MRIVVTGATGFIGRCLVRRPAESGHDVTAVVRSTAEVPFACRVPRLATLSREEILPIPQGAEAHWLPGSFSVDSSALWGDLGKGPTQTPAVALAEVARWWHARARA